MKEKPIIYVAVADDHPIVREGIIAMFDGTGNTCTIRFVISASDGTDLLVQLRKAKVIPDVCLMDISMQPMDGFDTIKELKKDWPDMKVLAFSMFETEMHILKMLFYGANGYIYKNSNPQELIIAIETLYEYEYYYNDAATRKMVYEIKNKLIKLPKLTEAEIEVLRYHCKGYTYMQTAEKLGTNYKSVQGHMDSLHNKLKGTSKN